MKVAFSSRWTPGSDVRRAEERPLRKVATYSCVVTYVHCEVAVHTWLEEESDSSITELSLRS